MPKQSPFRIIKRCRFYEKKGTWDYDKPVTRGLYVLYNKEGKHYDVKYIGVGGIGLDEKSGIFGRLKKHEKTKMDWTHYSFFEVHDNITRDEIRELESLFLTIFEADSKISIINKQKRSNKIKELGKKEYWPDIKKN